jgi:hypothetical protein
VVRATVEQSGQGNAGDQRGLLVYVYGAVFPQVIPRAQAPVSIDIFHGLIFSPSHEHTQFFSI